MWIELRISNIPLYQFKTQNALFRRLSKSALKIGTVSNKEFWVKNVCGGYYRCNIINQKLEYEFYIKLKDDIVFRRFELEMRLRLGKMGVGNIQILMINEPTFVINHRNYYKKFGVFYFLPFVP